MWGFFYSNPGQLFVFERAIILYRELGNQDIAAIILRSIGYSYHLQDESQKALEYYKKALNILQSSGNKRELALTHSMVGDEYARSGARKEALDHVAWRRDKSPVGQHRIMKRVR